MKKLEITDKFGKPKFKSELRRRIENSFESYKSSSGTLYIKDNEKGLTFEIVKVGDDKYDLAVIIEEDNAEYSPYNWSDPETPCGFQVLEEISLKEFNHLARDYLNRKFKDKDKFRKWLKEKLYIPTSRILANANFIIESMPEPNASNKLWKEYDRAMKFENKRQQKWAVAEGRM